MSEVQNLLNPRTHKKDKSGGSRITVGIICNIHGYVNGDHCPKCERHNSVRSPGVVTHDWVKGVWTDIGPEPIMIESKEHLIRECEKRGVMPRAFMKPKSQGQGFEIAK